jgi:membrane protein DedA with SNARE-associated domain
MRLPQSWKGHDRVDGLLHTIQALDPLVIYAVVFLIAFAENIFPPLPSDMAIVVAGSLAVVGSVSFAGVLILATAGSTVGFVTMYFVGHWFGDHILERGRISFIPVEGVRKVEDWFAAHGYWIIVANRFLAGTRAVVSFVAGMSEMDIRKTTVLSAISSLAWNAILVGSGYALGHEWERIGFYLMTYSRAVTAVVIVVVLVLAVRFLVVRRRKAS